VEAGKSYHIMVSLTPARLIIYLSLAPTAGIAIDLLFALYLQLTISNTDMIYPATVPWVVWA